MANLKGKAGRLLHCSGGEHAYTYAAIIILIIVAADVAAIALH